MYSSTINSLTRESHRFDRRHPYFTVIRKWLWWWALITTFSAVCARRAHASVLAFLGAETGDTTECSVLASGTGTSTTADSSEVNTGGYSYKLVTGANVAANAACFVGVGNTTASAVEDFYYRLDSAPATIAGNTFLMAHWDSQSPALASVYLEMTAGAPSLQLVNRISSVNVGTISINLNTWYRIVFAVTASAVSPVLTLKVCTVPGNSCQTLSDTTDSTGTSNPGFAYMIENGNLTSSVTAHYDDQIIVLGSVADPGPHEVLARQFNTTAGTYNAWTLSTGSGANAVWDNTPSDCAGLTQTGSCTHVSSSSSGVKTTGHVSFGNTTDAGATGHGSQIVGSADTINAIKVGWNCTWGGAAPQAVMNSIFISGATEIETAAATCSQGNQIYAYHENYPTTPTAAQLLVAEAGMQRSTDGNTVGEYIGDVWLMADVTPATPAANAGGGVINP